MAILFFRFLLWEILQFSNLFHPWALPPLTSVQCTCRNYQTFFSQIWKVTKIVFVNFYHSYRCTVYWLAVAPLRDEINLKNVKIPHGKSRKNNKPTKRCFEKRENLIVLLTYEALSLDITKSLSNTIPNETKPILIKWFVHVCVSCLNIIDVVYIVCCLIRSCRRIRAPDPLSLCLPWIGRDYVTPIWTRVRQVTLRRTNTLNERGKISLTYREMLFLKRLCTYLFRLTDFCHVPVFFMTRLNLRASCNSRYWSCISPS